MTRQDNAELTRQRDEALERLAQAREALEGYDGRIKQLEDDLRAEGAAYKVAKACMADWYLSARETHKRLRSGEGGAE